MPREPYKPHEIDKISTSRLCFLLSWGIEIIVCSGGIENEGRGEESIKVSSRTNSSESSKSLGCSTTYNKNEAGENKWKTPIFWAPVTSPLAQYGNVAESEGIDVNRWMSGMDEYVLFHLFVFLYVASRNSFSLPLLLALIICFFKIFCVIFMQSV